MQYTSSDRPLVACMEAGTKENPHNITQRGCAYVYTTQKVITGFSDGMKGCSKSSQTQEGLNCQAQRTKGYMSVTLGCMSVTLKHKDEQHYLIITLARVWHTQWNNVIT